MITLATAAIQALLRRGSSDPDAMGGKRTDAVTAVLMENEHRIAKQIP